MSTPQKTMRESTGSSHVVVGASLGVLLSVGDWPGQSRVQTVRSKLKTPEGSPCVLKWVKHCQAELISSSPSPSPTSSMRGLSSDRVKPGARCSLPSNRPCVHCCTRRRCRTSSSVFLWRLLLPFYVSKPFTRRGTPFTAFGTAGQEPPCR